MSHDPVSDGSPAVAVILVTRADAAGQWWRTVLETVKHPLLRWWMLDQDLQTALPHLHVRPNVVPAFLVTVHGWPVDWFPAPLPTSGDGGARDAAQFVTALLNHVVGTYAVR